MVAFGDLYLNEGRHNGKQIVPASWVQTSCDPRTSSRWDSDRRYGYGWWMRDLGGRQTCFAWGFGGQYIFVFRDLGLVVVATSSTSVNDERRGYRRDLFDLIEREVIEPLATGAPPPSAD
jgi:CubicO group peptidase (beta-lactamase class C family)